MKHFRMVLFLGIIILTSISASAQPYKMALGVRFSSQDAVVNTSATFKYFFKEKTAIETMLSFDPFSIGVLVEQHHALVSDNFTWYVGGGGFVGFTGVRNFGLQGVLGLDYKFLTIPLSLSLDWKPELSLVKEFSFEPAAVGASIKFTLK